MSGDRGSVSSVLVCWSLDLGSTPDGGLSFSFPLAFFGLCKSTSKENTSLPGQLRYFNKYLHSCNLCIEERICDTGGALFTTSCSG